jgi:methionine-gamma-lyase
MSETETRPNGAHRLEFDAGFATRCIHAGEAADPTTGAHGVPLYQNVTFAFETNGQVEDMRSGRRRHFTYTARANPTVRCLEVKLASLEGTATAVAFSSGMAAISGTLLSLVADGGHVVASDQLYDLSVDFLKYDLPAFGASATFVDMADSAAIEAAITPQTRLIYAEIFSNPLLRVVDPRLLAGIAHDRGLLCVIDNTFLSPALLRPADLGADIVIHSATKYLSGNGQVQGGVASGSRSLMEPIQARALHLGTAMSPFAAWLLLSGIHTLPLRIARHCQNAYRLASRLDGHPAVRTVHYPGLPADPGHALASALLGSGEDRFGGMMSVALSGGRDAFSAFVDALRLCTIAVSLGDCSTLVWPWHCDDIIRFSVGLEDFEDLQHDVLRALDGVARAVDAE